MRYQWLIVACALVAASNAGASADILTPRIGISGDSFTINRQPRFLVLISYFDAMRASEETLGIDFQYLREHGFDGIRIFPNWWDFRGGIAFGGDTLMNDKGQLRLKQVATLQRVLELAARRSLIVDVSFAYETVEGLSELRADHVGRPQGELPVNQVHLDAYERGLAFLTGALHGYEHVFFDIQNEYNGRVTHLGDDDVRRLRAAIQQADPNRLVTASLANEIGPEEVARRSNETGVDIVGWHESRNPWQFDAMDALVRRAKGETAKPIYMGEPAILEGGMTVESFVTAIAKAKAGGAAAWTFHTRQGFDLSRKPLKDLLTAPEREFVESFREKVDATPWGARSAERATER